MKPIKSSKKLHVVVDTNVFVSAFIWGGNPKKIIELWMNDKFFLLTSPFLVAEILLILEKFGLGKEDLQGLKEILERNSLRFFPQIKIFLCRDKKDNQILDLCLAGKADFLITGDKDLLALKKFKKTKIVLPKDFLKSQFSLANKAT